MHLSTKQNILTAVTLILFSTFEECLRESTLVTTEIIEIAPGHSNAIPEISVWMRNAFSGSHRQFRVSPRTFPMIDVASQACYRYSPRENWKTGGGLDLSGSCAAVALSENAITDASLPLVELRPGADPEACIRGGGKGGEGEIRSSCNILPPYVPRERGGEISLSSNDRQV